MLRNFGRAILIAASSFPVLADAPDPDAALPTAHLPSPAPIWLTFDDYPRDAVIQHLQGDVRYRLKIGTDGRVHNCTILRSSGHDILDKQTCRVLFSRAKLEPPRDAAGNLSISQYEGRVEWALPPGPVTPPEPKRVMWVKMIDGKPACTIDWDEKTRRDLPEPACREAVSHLPAATPFPVKLGIYATARELGLE